VLHIGCGTGRLGEALKKRWPNTSVTGIEEDRTAVTEARARLDEAVLALSQESTPPITGPFDTLILSGALTRAADPWSLLHAWAGKLREGGTLIARVPNITHYKLLKRLLLRDWRYEPDGPLAQDTLRFFSAGSLSDLLEGAGFGHITLQREIEPGSAWRAASALWSRAEELRTKSFIVTARRLGRSRSA
jgi:SAM-dependent methyltransferase